MTLDYIPTNLGAKFLDICAYIVKSELPGNYLYEVVSNFSETHAIVKEEKWQAAKYQLEKKGYRVICR